MRPSPFASNHASRVNEMPGGARVRRGRGPAAAAACAGAAMAPPATARGTLLALPRP